MIDSQEPTVEHHRIAKWGLAQAVAWIAFRDRKRISALTDDPASGRPYSLAELYIRYEPRVLEVAFLQAEKVPSAMDSARQELLGSLQAGRIGASANRPTSTQQEDVPKVEWGNLDFFDDLNEGPYAGPRKGADGFATKLWVQLQFDSSSMEREWPSNEARQLWLVRNRLEAHSIVALAHGRLGDEMPTSGTEELVRFRFLKDAIDEGHLKAIIKDDMANAHSAISRADLSAFAAHPSIASNPAWAWLVGFAADWLEAPTATAPSTAVSISDALTTDPIDGLSTKLRTEDPAETARRGSKYAAVVEAARRRWPKGNYPDGREMAETLAKERAGGFKADTIRQILSGTYRPMKKAGIKGL